MPGSFRSSLALGLTRWAGAAASPWCHRLAVCPAAGSAALPRVSRCLAWAVDGRSGWAKDAGPAVCILQGPRVAPERGVRGAGPAQCGGGGLRPSWDARWPPKCLDVTAVPSVATQLLLKGFRWRKERHKCPSGPHPEALCDPSCGVRGPSHMCGDRGRSWVLNSIPLHFGLGAALG